MNRIEKDLMMLKGKRVTYRIYPEDVEDFAYSAKDLLLRIAEDSTVSDAIRSAAVELLEDWPGEL